MSRVFVFIGNSKSTLAVSRFATLSNIADKNNLRTIWLEKRSGLHRIRTLCRILFIFIVLRRVTWICHGSYWPELIFHVLFCIKYSVIIQGSELTLNDNIRQKLHCWILNNAYAVGCRTSEQVMVVKKLSPLASPFILRMDHYEAPMLIDATKRRKIISVRASAPLYRQEFAARVASKTKDLLSFESETVYICYNGPDNDLHNQLYDKKVFGPVDKPQLTQLLSNACFVISVPRTDGLSNIVIEALIQGAYIISSEATYKPEFEPFQERFIIIPENIVDNSDALFSFLEDRIRSTIPDYSSSAAREAHATFSYDIKTFQILLGRDI
jgi:glycosyltransferase involved in cell wall biosynthesis